MEERAHFRREVSTLYSFFSYRIHTISLSRCDLMVLWIGAKYIQSWRGRIRNENAPCTAIHPVGSVAVQGASSFCTLYKGVWLYKVRLRLGWGSRACSHRSHYHRWWHSASGFFPCVFFFLLLVPIRVVDFKTKTHIVHHTNHPSLRVSP